MAIPSLSQDEISGCQILCLCDLPSSILLRNCGESRRFCFYLELIILCSFLLESHRFEIGFFQNRPYLPDSETESDSICFR